MDYYSNKQPNLIGEQMQTMVSGINLEGGSSSTISDKILEKIGEIYDTYIKENKMLFFFLVVIFILLMCRYYSVRERKILGDKKEGFERNEPSCASGNLFNDFVQYQKDKMYYNPPTMNPLHPQNSDEDIVHYPPDKMPINIPGENTVYTRDIYNRPDKQIVDFYDPPYDYGQVYNGSRQYSTGLVDTYAHAQDTDIVNPFGWSNNFNTTSGNFVKYMTDKNREAAYS